MVKKRLQFEHEKATIENTERKTGSVTDFSLFVGLLRFCQKVADTSPGENKRWMTGVFLNLLA